MQMEAGSKLRLVKWSGARRAAVLAGAVILATLSACSTDRVTSPSPVESPAQLSRSGEATRGLQRTQPQPQMVRSITVDSRGGELEIKELGFKLTIPRGAVLWRTTITVKSVAGSMVAYEFEPHGSLFLLPLTFSQDLTNTEKNGANQFSSNLSGGYFAFVQQLLPGGLNALVNELIPVRIRNNRAEFSIWHFSGYLMSTGRAQSNDESLF